MGGSVIRINMRMNQDGKSIRAISTVVNKTWLTMPQVERWCSPRCLPDIKDIKLMSLGAKPEYLEFLNKAILDRMPVTAFNDDCRLLSGSL